MQKLSKVIKSAVIIFVLVIMLSFTACSEPNGIVDIKKTGTQGLVDTYTITYSNGATSTFTITNGKNGVDGKNGEDGEDGTMITIEQVYNEWKECTEETDKSFERFLSLYLKDTIALRNYDETIATNSALRSVVSIVSTFTVYGVVGYHYESYGMFNHIVYDYGNYDVSSAGSGVIYRTDVDKNYVYILTNYHVVYYNEAKGIENNEDGISTKLKVFLYGQEFSENAISATYVGGAMQYDIAVLRCNYSDIFKEDSCAKLATIRNSNDVNVGEIAIAVGNPEGEGISATNGVISVDSEYITMKGADDTTEVTFRVMRVDTAINGGNSGGGLFDSAGNLIGIVNAKIIDETIENIGYALPTNVVIGVAENIIENATETVKTPLIVKLGITSTVKNSKAIYDTNSLTTKIVEEVFIQELIETGAGSHYGLKVNDRILSIKVGSNLYEITRMFQIEDALLYVDANTAVTFTVSRLNEQGTANENVEIIMSNLGGYIEAVN